MNTYTATQQEAHRDAVRWFFVDSAVIDNPRTAAKLYHKARYPRIAVTWDSYKAAFLDEVAQLPGEIVGYVDDPAPAGDLAGYLAHDRATTLPPSTAPESAPDHDLIWFGEEA